MLCQSSFSTHLFSELAMSIILLAVYVFVVASGKIQYFPLLEFRLKYIQASYLPLTHEEDLSLESAGAVHIAILVINCAICIYYVFVLV